MIVHRTFFSIGLAICAATCVSAEVSGDFAGPTLTLADDLGRPFYPTETHVFAGAIDRSITLSLGASPAQPAAAKSQYVVSEITSVPRDAVAPTDLTPKPLRATPVHTSRPTAMSERAMDSWSIGVFR